MGRWRKATINVFSYTPGLSINLVKSMRLQRQKEAPGNFIATFTAAKK